MRRKRPRLLTLYYTRLLRHELARLAGRFSKTAGQITARPSSDPDVDGELLAVNLKIIEELGWKIHSSGSRLVVLDASRYFGDDERVSRALHDFCIENGFRYIPLYRELLKDNEDRVLHQWTHDNHFNDTGNLILANSLYHWLAQTLPMRGSQ